MDAPVRDRAPRGFLAAWPAGKLKPSPAAAPVLAATLADPALEDWHDRRDRFGHLLGTFILQQFVGQAGWTEPDLRFWPYRAKDQVEVDSVLTRGRRTWGVKVKASATPTPAGISGLRRLGAQCGDDFAGGVLIHAGAHTVTPGVLGFWPYLWQDFGQCRRYRLGLFRSATQCRRHLRRSPAHLRCARFRSGSTSGIAPCASGIKHRATPMSVHVVRLGTPRLPGEGPRLGTVRRPPRGVPKAEFAAQNWYDVWFPNLAPSVETMQLGQRAETPAQWAAFARKYRAEMARPEARHDLALLATLSRTTDFSVGCYCEREDRCHRSLLKQLLIENGAKLA